MTQRIMKSQASPCSSATGYSADQESPPTDDLETIMMILSTWQTHMETAATMAYATIGKGFSSSSGNRGFKDVTISLSMTHPPLKF